MTKRDKNLSARNRIIQSIKTELRNILPQVTSETGAVEASLNAKIGSKTDDFFDLKNDIILSHDEFIIKWLTGLKNSDGNSYDWITHHIKNSKSFKKYLMLFLKRSYLIHYNELSKNRPREKESEIWIGQNNADYGLLVTPRFTNKKWENDVSEIRSFKYAYWTIGHVLSTGLVIPNKKEKIDFKDVDEFLTFFLNVIVRNSGSKYEYKIAELYCEYVKISENKLSIPLMIPEFRYNGVEKKHKYRLDFMIINPFTLDKVGFELSPWSTHGYLAKIKGLTQEEINKIASDNFSKEMRKHRDYFKKYNVYTLIYPDDELLDCENIFEKDIIPLLSPEKIGSDLSFLIMEEFFE